MIPITNITGRLGNQMFQFAALYSWARDNGLDYYLQDEFYFRDHVEAIRTLYSSDIPPRTDAVAIHVRRAGNPTMPSEPKYADNPFYVSLTKTDYYEKAIAMFPKENFLVFSDDIEWCKEKWEGLANFGFFHGTEIEDMNKMASCKAHIIANSSFSWWAAWLCPAYPDNKVIAPKKWFTDGVERTICPEQWIRI